MSDLAEAIRLVERQTAVKGACCVIADEGCPDESSLLGTRDGYLNLARVLLRLVDDADAGRSWIAEEGCAWQDQIKEVLYQLPLPSAWIVGAYLFRTHAEFIAALREIVDPQIGYPLTNDPQFAEPA